MPSLTSNLYQFGEFSLDPQSRVLRRSGAAVPLTPKAFDVLLLLIQNAGRIVTKDELMKAVWPDSYVEESNLTQTIFMVRKALDETGRSALHPTVQGQGYRFLAPVSEAADSRREVETPVPRPKFEKRSRNSIALAPAASRELKMAIITSGAVALALIVASAIWIWRSRQGPAEHPGKIMLAVLPFQNLTGDAAQEYVSDGLTEEMITELGNLNTQRLGVIARTSVMHYKNTQTPLDQIGRELNAQYVIEGSVRRFGARTDQRSAVR